MFPFQIQNYITSLLIVDPCRGSLVRAGTYRLFDLWNPSRTGRRRAYFFFNPRNHYKSLWVVSFTHISALSDDFLLSFVHGAENTQGTGYGGLVKLCLRNWCLGAWWKSCHAYITAHSNQERLGKATLLPCMRRHTYSADNNGLELVAYGCIYLIRKSRPRNGMAVRHADSWTCT